MGISYNSNIVTDGLVLCLDAANPRSYPGSGTSWGDLSGNGNSGTLTNGPTFSSGNGGSIVFDGVNDYVNLSTYLSDVGSYATIESFFKSNNGATGFCVLFGWGDGDNYYSNFGIGNWFSLWGDESIFLGVNSQHAVMAERGGHSKYHDGNWHHAVATIGLNNYRIYVDGELKTTSFAYGSASYNPSNIFGFSANTVARIGSRPYGGGSGWFNGYIPSTKIYNRILSADEVRRNYNATRGRYGY